MTKTTSLLSALLCTLIWGTTFIAQDTGMDDIGPFTFNAVRFFVGFLAVAPLAFIFEKKKFFKSINKDQKQFINRLYGAYRYFYNRAIQYINNYNKFTQKTSYLINIKDTVNIIVNLKEEKNKFSNITMRRLLKDNYPEWIKEFNIPVPFGCLLKNA